MQDKKWHREEFGEESTDIPSVNFFKNFPAGQLRFDVTESVWPRAINICRLQPCSFSICQVLTKQCKLASISWPTRDQGRNVITLMKTPHHKIFFSCWGGWYGPNYLNKSLAYNLKLRPRYNCVFWMFTVEVNVAESGTLFPVCLRQ